MSEPSRVLETQDVPRGTPEINYIKGEATKQIWPAVFELVASACDETLSPSDVFRALVEGKATMWIVHDGSGIDACAVTQITDHPGARIYHVLTLGGTGFKRWANDLQKHFERHARQTECDFMRCYARRGLAKWLKRMGWRERQVTMEWRNDGR